MVDIMIVVVLSALLLRVRHTVKMLELRVNRLSDSLDRIQTQRMEGSS